MVVGMREENSKAIGENKFNVRMIELTLWNEKGVLRIELRKVVRGRVRMSSKTV